MPTPIKNQQEDDREDVDFEISSGEDEDFTRSGQQNIMNTEETEELIEDELRQIEFKNELDPAY
jgi:hypothetical protein